MKTVYLVEKSRGEWDDRVNWTDRVYLDKEQAEKYIEKYNKQLDTLKEKMGKLYSVFSQTEDNYEDLFWNRYDRIYEQNGAYLRTSKLYE